MRDMDLPIEILEDEDPTQTIPRRFGLSDVVERQIRTYRSDVKRRVRLTDDEIRGLFRFVIRRPDCPEVFREVGRLLAVEQRTPGWIRYLPAGLAHRALRREEAFKEQSMQDIKPSKRLKSNTWPGSAEAVASWLAGPDASANTKGVPPEQRLF